MHPTKKLPSDVFRSALISIAQLDEIIDVMLQGWHVGNNILVKGPSHNSSFFLLWIR